MSEENLNPWTKWDIISGTGLWKHHGDEPSGGFTQHASLKPATCH